MSRRRTSRFHAPTRGHLAVVAPPGEADFLAATPVLEAAVRTPSWSRVTLFAPEPWCYAFEGGPAERHVRPGPPPGARELLDLGVDGALLLDGRLRSAWSARRAGVASRAGFGPAAVRALLTHSIVPTSAEGRVELVPSATLARDVGGLLGVWAPDLRPRVGVPAETGRVAQEELARLGLAERGFVWIDPDPDYGAAGAWPAERFGALARRLAAELGLPAVLARDPDGARYPGGAGPAAAAASASGGAATLAPAELSTPAGRAALARRAELCIVTSGAGRVVAAAFERPCLHLAGPGPVAPAVVGGDRARFLRVEGLPCAPCLSLRCAVPGHPCMRELSVERVLAAAEDLLRAEVGAERRGA